MQDNFSEGNKGQTGQSGEREECPPALTSYAYLFPQAEGIDNTYLQRVNSRND